MRRILGVLIVLVVVMFGGLVEAGESWKELRPKKLRKEWLGRPHTDFIQILGEPTLVVPADEDSGPVVFYMIPRLEVWRNRKGAGVEDPHAFDELIFEATDEEFVERWNLMVEENPSLASRGTELSHQLFLWSLDHEGRVESVRNALTWETTCDMIYLLQLKLLLITLRKMGEEDFTEPRAYGEGDCNFGQAPKPPKKKQKNRKK